LVAPIVAQLPNWFKNKTFVVSELPDQCNVNLSDEAREFYESNVELTVEKSIKLCELTVTQSLSQLWRDQRKLRITGSKAHPIYRARSDPKRIEYFKSHKSLDGIVAIKYGMDMESTAREKYIEITEEYVIETGLVVKQGVWWLAASPDGLFIDNQGDLKVLEIKCPYSNMGQQIDVPCLDKDGNLKKSDKWFTQIQLTMFVCNAKSADLFLYSSVDSKIVNVIFDKVFC
jgi:hypothetical protein